MISVELLSELLKENIDKVMIHPNDSDWIKYKEYHTPLSSGIKISDLVKLCNNFAKLNNFTIDSMNEAEIFNICDNYLKIQTNLVKKEIK